MPEPGRDEHEGGVAVGEGADDLRPSSHLTDDALERIVGADASPVLGRKVVTAMNAWEGAYTWSDKELHTKGRNSIARLGPHVRVEA